MKVRLPDFTTFEKSRTFLEPTSDTDLLYQTALTLLESFKGPYRLLGIYLGNFSTAQTKSLFADQDNKDKLWQTIDNLKERGLDIKKATILDKKPR